MPAIRATMTLLTKIKKHRRKARSGYTAELVLYFDISSGNRHRRGTGGETSGPVKQSVTAASDSSRRPRHKKARTAPATQMTGCRPHKLKL